MYKGIVTENEFGSKILKLIRVGIPVLDLCIEGIDNIRIDKDTGKIFISVEFEVDSLEI